MHPPAPARARRGTWVLAAGSLLSGLLAYVFFALVTRALGAGAAAPVAVLWAWWSFAAAAVTFPVQHWITRTAALPAGEAGVRRGMRHVAGAVAGASVLAGVVSWLARDRLFASGEAWFPLLVVGVGLGSGLLGVVRGVLSGRRLFWAVGVGLVAENGVRCLVAALLMAADVAVPVAYGLALLAGYAAVALWPAALVPRTTGSGEAEAALTFVTGASAGQLLAQVTLTGGPVLLAGVGGAPAEVTALFAALALFRAPYTFAIGLVSALTGRLTALVAAGRHDTLRRIREGVVSATLVVGVLGAVLGGWLGPDVLQLVFGQSVRLPAVDTGLVAVGSVFALANLVITVGLLARGRSVAVARTWLVAAPFGVVGYLLLGGGDALTSTCCAFLLTETAAWLGFLALEVRSDRLVGRQEDR